MKNNLVLYHGPSCFDGLMSALLMKLYFEHIYEPVELIPVKYNEPIPDTTDKHVYIVDFSYPKEVLAQASETAASITMLDHHLTAANQWDGYKKFRLVCNSGCCLSVNLEEHKSGALLTMDWINEQLSNNPDKGVFTYPTLRRVVNAISDGDLWKFQYKDTKVIQAALGMIPFTIKDWEDFIVKQHPHEFNKAVDIAKHYLDAREKIAQDLASKSQMVMFAGHEVPIVNVPAMFTSRVGEILSKDQSFAIMYCLTVDKLYVSLRSQTGVGLNVQEIAQQYGGGGHFHAAACYIPVDKILDLLTGKL